jgi:hypothetical protein
MHCTQCGVSLTRDNVLDYYELKQSYVSDARSELTDRKLDRLIGIDTRPMRMTGTSSLNQDILIGVFCGAKCLCQYVQAHVGPDADTE